MRKHSKEFLQNLTPHHGYRILVEGNKRFVRNLKSDHDHLEMINETREGQYPFAVILSCMDSRTSVELIFDQGLGDLFSIRVAGNIVNDDILASIEYAIKYVGSKVLMVLGHTECGAITSAKLGVKDGHITSLLDRIQPSITSSTLLASSSLIGYAPTSRGGSNSTGIARMAKHPAPYKRRSNCHSAHRR